MALQYVATTTGPFNGIHYAVGDTVDITGWHPRYLMLALKSGLLTAVYPVTGYVTQDQATALLAQESRSREDQHTILQAELDAIQANGGGGGGGDISLATFNALANRVTSVEAAAGSAETQAHATATYPAKANNLSDLASASAARTNLGLGTAATQASSAFDTAGAATAAQASAVGAAVGLALVLGG